MPPKSRLAKRKNKKLWLIPLFIFLIFPVIFFLLPKTWNGSDRLSLAINGNENIKVVVFDPPTSTITTINIPTSTQVNAARDLGSWQLGSIWKLGKDEGHNGLLARTITKTFKIPIDHWSDVNRSDTSLTIRDKISLAYFEIRVNASSKRKIDITDMLTQTHIKGVGEGYILERSLPPSIIGLFNLADENIEDWMVAVIDASGPTYEISELTKIIDNTGAKVISITNEDMSEINCIVNGNNTKLVNYFKNLLSCEIGDIETENFGMVIKIGTGFVL